MWNIFVGLIKKKRPYGMFCKYKDDFQYSGPFHWSFHLWWLLSDIWNDLRTSQAKGSLGHASLFMLIGYLQTPRSWEKTHHVWSLLLSRSARLPIRAGVYSGHGVLHLGPFHQPWPWAAVTGEWKVSVGTYILPIYSMEIATTNAARIFTFIDVRISRNLREKKFQYTS